MHDTRRVTSLRTTWAQLLRTAGSRAPMLRRSLVQLTVAALLQGAALATLLPFFTRLLADGPGAALPWLALLTALALGSALCRWLAQGFDYNGHMAQATHELRTELGLALRRMPLLDLQARSTGELNATLLGNVDENLSYVLTVTNLVLSALLCPLVMTLAVLCYDLRLGVALLVTFACLLPLYRWRRPETGVAMRRLASAHEGTSSAVVEYVQGLPVLRAARCEGLQAKRLDDAFETLRQVQREDQAHGSAFKMLSASVIEIGLFCIVVLGLYWNLAGSLSLGVVIAVAVAMARFAEALSTFVTYTVIYDLIEAALERIDALLDAKPLPVATQPAKPASALIEVDALDFAYAPGLPNALHEIHAAFSPGTLTALVGHSGSGKSTLTRLLMRHADPSAGQVRLSGVALPDIAPAQLADAVSVVFQDVYLFDDTVRANIRMGRPDASDQEVEDAARAAQCLEFIARLPEGWDTVIGDGGGRLSGGERQRVSIARALLKDAPVVILDEPTAALDTESEVAVQRAIDALVRERTVIVIAHRLSTIMAAHQILVFDHGRIVERGRHAELLAHGGAYARLWQAQMQANAWQAQANA